MAVKEQYGVSITQRSTEATRETFLSSEQTRGPKADPTVTGSMTVSNQGWKSDANSLVTTTQLNTAYATANSALQTQLNN